MPENMNEKAEITQKKKSKYRLVSDELRQKLLSMVHDEQYTLKEAAKILNIGYENAKIINRAYRQDGRSSRITTKRRF
jgi:transposase